MEVVFGDATSNVLRLSPCVGYSVADDFLQSLNDHSCCSQLISFFAAAYVSSEVPEVVMN